MLHAPKLPDKRRFGSTFCPTPIGAGAGEQARRLANQRKKPRIRRISPLFFLTVMPVGLGSGLPIRFKQSRTALKMPMIPMLSPSRHGLPGGSKTPLPVEGPLWIWHVVCSNRLPDTAPSPCKPMDSTHPNLNATPDTQH
jgi:hypothetical protein